MFQRRDRFDFGGGGHSIRNGPSGVGSRSTCSFRFGGILGRTRKTIPSSRLYRALERESRIVDSGSQGGRVIGVAVHGIEGLSASTCYDWRGDKFVHGSNEIIRVLVEGCGAEFSLVAGICFRTATKTSVDFAENFFGAVLNDCRILTFQEAFQTALTMYLEYSECQVLPCGLVEPILLCRIQLNRLLLRSCEQHLHVMHILSCGRSDNG